MSRLQEIIGAEKSAFELYKDNLYTTQKNIMPAPSDHHVLTIDISKIIQSHES